MQHLLSVKSAALSEKKKELCVRTMFKSNLLVFPFNYTENQLTSYANALKK